MNDHISATSLINLMPSNEKEILTFKDRFLVDVHNYEAIHYLKQLLTAKRMIDEILESERFRYKVRINATEFSGDHFEHDHALWFKDAEGNVTLGEL